MLPSKRKTVAILAVLAVGSLTGISFAQTNATSSVTVGTSGVSDGSFAQVTAAGTDGYHGAAPSWTPIVGAPGQIPDADQGNQAGDLYLVETGDYTGDLLVTVFLNNPAELTDTYSYLNLAITAYEEDTDGTWITTPVAGVDASGDHTTYLSLTGGYVTLPLSQSAAGNFSISLDAGSFYATSNDGTLDPQFFIDVKPA